MRDVRRIGRRTWLARLSGGALAIVAGLKFSGGREGYGIRIAVPDVPTAAAQEQAGDDMSPYDTHRIPLGQGGSTTAYVLVRGGEAALVDTGVAGSAQRIGEVIQEAGLGWDAVQHVILTHHHPDHVGSIGDVLERAQGATVWAGAADIPNISPNISAPRDIRAAADGAEIFVLRVIATPGHTAGHISVFDSVGAALVVGDAAVNVGGNLAGSPAQYTADMAQARDSLRKLSQLTFETAWFMHGEPIYEDASAQFEQLVASLPPPAGQPAAPPAQLPASQTGGSGGFVQAPRPTGR